MLFVVCKIIHVIGNVFWLGGGVAAAYAFVQLAQDDAKVRLSAARALRSLTLMLVTPGMLLSLSAGLVMLLMNWTDFHYAKAPWMHIKLTVGLIAAAFSGVLSGRLRRAAAGGEVPAGAVRTAGIVLLLSAVVAVSMVMTRFGEH